jgi:hypothetical protein
MKKRYQNCTDETWNKSSTDEEIRKTLLLIESEQTKELKTVKYWEPVRSNVA